MGRQMGRSILSAFLIFISVVLLALPVQGSVSPRYIANCYILSDSLAGDSLSKLPADSIASDSTEKKSNAIDAPVIYESNDSMVWVRGGNAYLYGEAKVNYQNIELTAGTISMNMDSSLVHATAMVDSLGNSHSLPVFKDGGTPYESDRMSYNFKSKKGYINNVYTQQSDGFLMGKNAKKDEDNTFYAQNARYTTCDASHPHFYVALTRAKMRPEKDVDRV